jgi:hypothetical protein
MSSAGYAEPAALEARTPARAIGKPVAARALADESRSLRRRFQSFWHGGVLSPYEQFCLKSFVDCGYTVDLYTYDLALAVPAGVRVRDAAELISPDEVFVYQAEGFGKGSPSAFSNYFRYKLLVEKGGWWIDTDVVCLTDRIPVVDEFFARQDNDIVACGTMYFEPRHPVMVQCLEQARKLGRAVKWGDTGPHLLTRVLEERGCVDRALPPSVLSDPPFPGVGRPAPVKDRRLVSAARLVSISSCLDFDACLSWRSDGLSSTEGIIVAQLG